MRPLHYDYRSSTVSVKIIVEDINDNFPLFGQPFYTVTITEAAVVNTTLLKVQVRRQFVVYQAGTISDYLFKLPNVIGLETWRQTTKYQFETYKDKKAPKYEEKANKH